jgi:integrase
VEHVVAVSDRVDVQHAGRVPGLDAFIHLDLAHRVGLQVSIHPLRSHLRSVEPLAKQEGETEAQWQKRLTKEQKAELATWQKAHRWHPHQLRHNAATELRKEFGIEAARIILVHHSAEITEVYAEKDEQQAIEAIMKVG